MCDMGYSKFRKVTNHSGVFILVHRHSGIRIHSVVCSLHPYNIFVHIAAYATVSRADDSKNPPHTAALYGWCM